MRNFKNITNKNSLDDMSTGEAIPAIDVLKRSIINGLVDVCSKERELMRYKMINRTYNRIDEVEFSRSIISLFNLIKGMARSKNIYYTWKKVDKKGDIPLDSDFKRMELLEYNKRSFTVSELVSLKNYLIYILHVLRITDLLIKLDVDVNEEMMESY